MKLIQKFNKTPNYLEENILDFDIQEKYLLPLKQKVQLKLI